MRVIHHSDRGSRWSWAIYAFFYAVLLTDPVLVCGSCSRFAGSWMVLH